MTAWPVRIVIVAALLGAAGCGSASGAVDAPPPATRATTTTTETPHPPSDGRRLPQTTTSTTTTSSAPAPSELSASAGPTTTCPDADPDDRAGEASAPDRLTVEIDAALANPAFEGLEVSVSIWVDGYGEVTTRSPDLALLPASNQKLYTAIGAYELLDGDKELITEVRQVGSDLVLVAGGDPTLTTKGPHSLDELARQTRNEGVTSADRLIVDVSHFEPATSAAGWQDWHIPRWVGPMSALVVDDNRYRSDIFYVADPALANGERFVERLARHGVDVTGPVVVDVVPSTGGRVASVRSAPVAHLVSTMLLRSDNEIAESLLREIGVGSTAEGVARIDAVLAGWCLDLSGTSADGSGLSRGNFRSAREWRRLLQAAATEPWADELLDALPVAGRTGTLSRRLTSSGVAGNVSAKTGSIIGGRALSGYATTSSGRRLVFGILVNGDPGLVGATRPAIDAVVEAALLNG